MLIFGVALSSGVACAITRRADVARVARVCGIGAAVLGASELALTILLTSRALDMPGQSRADRQRMLSNAVAECLYTAAFAGVASGVPLLVTGWVLRKHGDRR